MSLQSDLKWIKDNLVTKEQFNSEINILKKDIKIIKRTSNKIRKDLEMVTGDFDKEQVSLKSRVERIENHVGLPSLQ